MTQTQQLPARRAGVLLPLFSIRTTTGWGLGEIPDIPRFAGWAGRAGLSVLQLLPASEVSGGETSPYAASTAFALDPVYLSLDESLDFIAAGGRAAMSDEDRATLDHVISTPCVAWSKIRPLKERAVDRAFAHFLEKEWRTDSERAHALKRFLDEHRAWIQDYALFSALHDRERKAWWDWAPALKAREPAALERARGELQDAILKKAWLQWLLDDQWRKARQAAADAGVRLKGDLPFMVSGDSADVWARQGDFRLDRRVGTPPDAFSATGQDWGLPAYDWEAMAENDFAWLRDRAARSGALYDLYRIDHVIGLYRTYSRAADDPEDAGFTPSEEEEQIEMGEVVLPIFKQHGEVVAEDLGMVPPFLRPSLAKLGIPGYKVLRWERDWEVKEPTSPFLDPTTWDALSVATNGTHDIETNAEWYDDLSATDREALLALPGLEHLDPAQPFSDHVREALLRVVYAAPSVLAINQFQDFYGGRERVNVPGTVADTNWCYRMPMDLAALEADAGLRERLAALAKETGRRG